MTLEDYMAIGTRISSLEKDYFEKTCNMLKLKSISRYGTVNFSSYVDDYFDGKKSTKDANIDALKMIKEFNDDEKVHHRFLKYLERWKRLHVVDENFSFDFYHMPEKYRKIVPKDIAKKLEHEYFNRFRSRGNINPDGNKSTVDNFSWVEKCDIGYVIKGESFEWGVGQTLNFLIHTEVSTRLDITDNFVNFLQRFCKKEYNYSLEELFDMCYKKNNGYLVEHKIRLYKEYI